MTLDELKDKIGIGDDKVYAAMGAFDNPDDLVEAGKKILATSEALRRQGPRRSEEQPRWW